MFCKRLSKIKDEDIKLHTFADETIKCKVVDVYDGDTITIIFRNHCFLEKYKLRLYGIDTPELKPLKDIENRDIIIENAKKARDALKNKILNKIVKITFMKEEKYGRLLGTIYYNKENINDWMIKNNFGKSYFGGKKE